MRGLTPRDAGPAESAGARVARLYERHARAVYGLCVMLLRDPHEAEDALQSTFLSAHAALVRGTVPREETAWLAAVARNECRGRLRARMTAPAHGDPAALDTVPDPRPAPGELLPDPRVRQALAALSESQREAVLLRDVLGLRAREVGAALGLSLPAVEALLFRARRQLRLRLRPVGMLVVPAAVAHALAEAVPGFVAPAAAAGFSGSVGGAAGVGLLAKLTGAPAAAKVAAGVAAVAAGSVAVQLERTPSRHPVLPPPPAPGVAATGVGDARPERDAALTAARERDGVAQQGRAVTSGTAGRPGRPADDAVDPGPVTRSSPAPEPPDDAQRDAATPAAVAPAPAPEPRREYGESKEDEDDAVPERSDGDAGPEEGDGPDDDGDDPRAEADDDEAPRGDVGAPTAGADEPDEPAGDEPDGDEPDGND